MKNNYLGHIVSYISSIITIVGLGWFVGEPAIKAYINSEIKEYVHSREYIKLHEDTFLMYVDDADFKEKLNHFLDARLTTIDNASTNNQVSFRDLLAVKMGVDRENVAGILARMYKEDRPRLLNTMRVVNREHPGNNIWDVD